MRTYKIHKGIYYFPSYEMAMLHPNTYKPDNRHVTSECVGYIMGRFEKAYIAT